MKSTDSLIVNFFPSTNTQRLREAQAVRRGHAPADQQRVRGERLSNKFNLLRITCFKLNIKYLIWHVFFSLRPLFFFESKSLCEYNIR